MSPAIHDPSRDRECIERLRAGDARALAELLDRHGDLLYSLALRITGRSADAEDVVQEAWVQAWRSAGSFDAARGTVGAWLVTLVRSRAIDRIRSRASRDRAETASGAEPAAPADDASVEAGQRMLSARVRAALERLAPPQRQALELAYFGGLSQTEVSERLAAPLGTVKSWTRQGLLRLRELMSEEAVS